MLKNLFFTTFLAFSSSYVSLNETPFKHSQKEQEQSPYEYYKDYIDLYFFDTLDIHFITGASNQLNFFRVNAFVNKDKVFSKGVYSNDFKYFKPEFFIPNPNVGLSVNTYNEFDGNNWTISNARLTEKIDRYGFAVATDIFDGFSNSNLYSLIPNTWLPFQEVDTDDNEDYEITINIPYGNMSQPPGDFVNTLKNNLRFFNQNYYDKFLLGLSSGAYEEGFTNGYDNGYTDGYIDGNNDGLIDGYEDAYNKGYNDAIASDFNAYSWLTGIFSAMGGLLSIQLLPGVSIGGILILIMVLTLLPFLIGLLKGGK